MLESIRSSSFCTQKNYLAGGIGVVSALMGRPMSLYELAAVGAAVDMLCVGIRVPDQQTAMAAGYTAAGYHGASLVKTKIY